MNPDEHILDDPEQKGGVKNKLKSRLPSNLMILNGIVFSLLGLYSLYFFFNSLYRIIQPSEFQQVGFVEITFLRMFLFQLFKLIFGGVLLIGGIGLVRHKMIGWTFGLAAAIFAIILPVLVVALISINEDLRLSVPAWFIFLFVLFFGLSLTLLLSKTIRNFFAPKIKSYGVAGIIILILSLSFVIPTLLFFY